MLIAAEGNIVDLENVVALAEAAGFPQGDLKIAKFELKALRLRDSLAIVLSGATGSYARFINGCYAPTSEKVNGKSVFRMVADEKTCLFFSSNGVWLAAAMDENINNKCHGWAFTEEGLAHPMLAKNWTIFIGKKEWELQPKVATSVLVTKPSRPFPPLLYAFLENPRIY